MVITNMLEEAKNWIKSHDELEWEEMVRSFSENKALTLEAAEYCLDTALEQLWEGEPA